MKSSLHEFPISECLQRLVEHFLHFKAEVFVVGGSVRNFLMGYPLTDYDLEIYHLPQTILEEELAKLGEVICVGKSFGIYKLEMKSSNNRRETFDVALPRTENKIGVGHRNFSVAAHPHLPFKEASTRRDFTINSMGIRLPDKTLFDPHRGVEDIQNKILRHVSLAFAQDPLRVLRGAQFAARFDFQLHPKTLVLCQNLKDELPSLSHERIAEEVKKMLLAPHPALAFTILEQTSALQVLFPELKALQGCPQGVKWHPEGDVWVHTLMALQIGAKIIREESALTQHEQLLLQLSILCHDLGKPSTTQNLQGQIKSHGHEQAGLPYTKSLLQRMGLVHQFYSEVAPLVLEHLKPMMLFNHRHELKPGAIKKLSQKVNIESLCRLAKADMLGRTTEEARSGRCLAVEWLQEEASRLKVYHHPEAPLLMGRHLIELGLLPSPDFKNILEAAYQAQCEGAFDSLEAAKLWCKEKIKDL